MSEATTPLPSAVAVVIYAFEAEDAIAATVSGAYRIPHVMSVLVVDDGSSDGTSAVAQQSGAVVVRHKKPQGRAAAFATGAKVVAVREMVDPLDPAAVVDRAPQALLFIDAELGYSTENAAALVTAVMSGEADLALGVDTEAATAGFWDTSVVGEVRAVVKLATGLEFLGPLARVRCSTRAAWEASLPHGHGSLTDVVWLLGAARAGSTVVEVPCEFTFAVPAAASFWEWLRARAALLRLRVQVGREAR